MMLLDYVQACRPALRIGVFARNPHPHHHALPVRRGPPRHWAFHPIRKLAHASGGACRWVPFLVAAGIGAAAPAPSQGFGPSPASPGYAGSAGFGTPEAGGASGVGVGGGSGSVSPGGSGSSQRASASYGSTAANPSGLSPIETAAFVPLGAGSASPTLLYLYGPAAAGVLPSASPILDQHPGLNPVAPTAVQKPAPVTPVPEPSSLSLLCAAALLLYALRSRRLL